MARGPDVADPEAAARVHARGVTAGDPRVREDLAPGAELTPPDLFDRLLTGGFRDFELVAHAKIGAHHVFKTRYVGPALLVVQARWARAGDGPWQIREAEITRTAVPAGP